MTLLVLGAGVNGLTTSKVLLEAGYQVEVWAESMTPYTTSDVAAAIWYPYKAQPVERVRGWGLSTLKYFYSICEEKQLGVDIRSGRAAFCRRMGYPWWKDGARNFRLVDSKTFTEPYVTQFQAELPVIDMSVYLPFLFEEVKARGAEFCQRKVQSVDETRDFKVVINCTGLGAGALLGDGDVFPIRGQILEVESPNVGEWFTCSDYPEGVVYMIPRRNSIILGGVSEEGNASLEVDDTTTEQILKRIVHVSGFGFRDQDCKVHVGLRPGRKVVRLEHQRRGDQDWIHNYGHGGSGVTLSWGCAEEVLSLLSELMRDSSGKPS